MPIAAPCRYFNQFFGKAVDEMAIRDVSGRIMKSGLLCSNVGNETLNLPICACSHFEAICLNLMLSFEGVQLHDTYCTLCHVDTGVANFGAFWREFPVTRPNQVQSQDGTSISLNISHRVMSHVTCCA